MAILNTVNEVSVEAFLNKQINFMDIAIINQKIMQKVKIEPVKSVQQLLELDSEIRQMTKQVVSKNG